MNTKMKIIAVLIGVSIIIGINYSYFSDREVEKGKPKYGRMQIYPYQDENLDYYHQVQMNLIFITAEKADTLLTFYTSDKNKWLPSEEESLTLQYVEKIDSMGYELFEISDRSLYFKLKED